jgi:glutathione synthase/RimK-type ligase-like ATP-grasp enzyme
VNLDRPVVLVAGGDRDPNIAAIAGALAAAEVPARVLAFGAQARPWIAWDLDADTLIVAGEPVAPRAAFVRHDVFTQLADPRPQPGFRASAWSIALQGWLLAHPEVRCFNGAGAAGPSNKPHVLALARAEGLAIPRTLVTNHAPTARGFATPAIAKPIGGGDVTRPLDEALALAKAPAILAAPAIVQERLIAPELRIYVVGDRTFAFEVRSPLLDYRAGDDTEVVYLGDGPEPITRQVRSLAHRTGLDYAAADLKSRPDGTLVFLELNTAPMFARFDQACDGALCRTMVAWLIDVR